MTKEEFDRFFEQEVKTCKEIMDEKNADYAPGDDKLANFKQAAKLAAISPEKALWGFDLKHRTSIHQGIEGKICNGRWPLGWWQEKIRDHINYMVLLLALIEERHGKSN